jgi:hypothetical protein
MVDHATRFASAAYGAGGGLVKLTKDATGEIEAEEIWRTVESPTSQMVPERISPATW